MENQQQYEDADAYSYSDRYKLSFRDIILMHLKKIGEFSSCEWKGGYWQTRVKLLGPHKIDEKFYTEDTRERYSNAVEYMSDLLSAHYDPEMVKNEEGVHKQLEELNTNDKAAYREQRRLLSRKLFRALCNFLFRKKYLEIGSISD